MSEQKYYVQINKKLWNNLNPLQLGGVGIDLCPSDYDYGQYFIAEYEPESSYAKVNKNSFTKSELGKIMGGVLYRTFAHQFEPELAEELYKLGYRTTQTTEEWIEARYEFDNIWEWINPLIELVLVDEV